MSGIKVPADGNTGQYFVAPRPNNIRGPFPSPNTAANNNFLSHDGVTTFYELVDAQQNVYNLHYETSILLATLSVILSNDILTQEMRIKYDATSRNAALDFFGTQPGLNGRYKFESDTVLRTAMAFLSTAVVTDLIFEHFSRT
ncbi:hypothetical protein CC80DRAFT_507555 [Byssothecium circinans]|uniref:Heme haloperoxidase family profile domain-containing protein n=1 Tax=Byssothecium circinans TaxID=147558 RepID=A0A6A5TL36_9PLEO|nr:hypothetical protein CC80DRAFT_507555 [Byssothecium circinans]